MEEEKKAPLSAFAEVQAALAEANRKLLTDDQLQQAQKGERESCQRRGGRSFGTGGDIRSYSCL
jgi:hypothetical protein